jgi:23S rRNA (uracil1939-C5)-methyltransferase
MHFGSCGGCALQDLSPEDYRALKRQTVIDALAKAGLADVTVEQPVLAALRSRRRAVFKIKSLAQGLHIGFHAAKSHTVIDMRQCEVLTPGLFALVGALRRALEPLFGVGEAAELHVTESETGFDGAFRWRRNLTPVLTGELTRALSGLGIARLTLNGELVFETGVPSVHLDGITVALPSNPFLQATAEGESVLRQKVLALTDGAKRMADLFSGLGTFALPLARRAKVHAVEADADALAALAAAARGAKGLKPVTTEKRDLFKRPLSPSELAAFDAVVLDPPRAGAEAQVRQLAASSVPLIAYVSCDAQSFARDAAILAAAGFAPGPVTPIDQFLFSSHIELVAGFRRTGGKRR